MRQNSGIGQDLACHSLSGRRKALPGRESVVVKVEVAGETGGGEDGVGGGGDDGGDGGGGRRVTMTRTRPTAGSRATAFVARHS